MGGEIEIKSARKKWLKSNIKNAIKTKRTPENIRNAYVLPRAWFFSCCFSCTPMQIASHKSSMKCKNPMITLRIGEKEITNTTQHRRRKKESQPILVWFVSPENYNDADSKYKHNKLKSQLKKSWIMPKTHRLERRSREKKTRASTHTHTHNGMWFKIRANNQTAYRIASYIGWEGWQQWQSTLGGSGGGVFWLAISNLHWIYIGVTAR